jgi:hypothetical protein
MATDQALRDELLGYQRNEITEYHIDRQLAKTIRAPEHGEIPEQIAKDELGHYQRKMSHSSGAFSRWQA